MDFTDLYFIR